MIPSRRRAAFSLVASTIAITTAIVLADDAIPAPAHPAWPSVPNVNLPVCTAPGNQAAPVAISDGAGGIIVAWEDDRRDGDRDLYAQRIDSTGTPAWAKDGVPICVVSGEQRAPRVVGDGEHGCVVVWEDHRDPAGWDVYAQRLTAAGAPLWHPGGVPLTQSRGDQRHPAIAGDHGGVVVAWEDHRDSTSTDVYAQRVDSTGAPGWSADGVPVCVVSGDQFLPVVRATGPGRWLVTWMDGRTSRERPGIFAQTLLARGDPAWAVGGVAVCVETGATTHPVSVTDDSSGVIVAWDDIRIHAQRVVATGTRIFPDEGVLVSGGPGAVPAVARDGAGGAIVVWQGPGRRRDAADLMAQRISRAGAVQWPADTILVAAEGLQTLPVIAADGAGGAVVAWEDRQGATGGNVYVQRITAAGARVWPARGVLLSTAPGQQSAPAIVADGTGGAIAVWQDERNGKHLYAQRIDGAGNLGGTVHPRRGLR